MVHGGRYSANHGFNEVDTKVHTCNMYRNDSDKVFLMPLSAPFWVNPVIIYEYKAIGIMIGPYPRVLKLASVISL